MLNTFEIRMADLLADALVGADNLGPVGRVGSVSAPTAGDVSVQVRVGEFSARPHVGDDKRAELRQAGEIRLRPTLHLSGDAVIALAAEPPNGAAALQARERLMTMLDRVLLALAPQTVRTGQAFATDSDQGFELDRFRLNGTGPLTDDSMGGPLQIELSYGFEGRFWPVEEFPEGDLITTLPTRMNVMPIRLPDDIRAQAGGSNLSVPIRLNITATNGAVAALVARLEGAAPPGLLIGDGAPAPAGYTGFSIDADGAAALIYQPPADLAGSAVVRVETRLAHPDRPSIELTRFEIEVTPS